MVEGTGLENRHTGNGIESSNLSLSAPALREACRLRGIVMRGGETMLGRVAEWFKAHAWKVCVRS